MAAVARILLYPRALVVLASRAAILFGFHLCRHRAVAQVVRALNRLLHVVGIPNRHRTACEPLAVRSIWSKAAQMMPVGKCATFSSSAGCRFPNFVLSKMRSNGEKTGRFFARGFQTGIICAALF
jgi:hypothetical protein